MKKYEKVWKSMKWIFRSKTMNWTLARIWFWGSIWIDVWNDSMNFSLEIRSSYFFILFHNFSVLYILWKSMKKYEKVWKSMKNKSFKTTSEQINHLFIFSVAFPSSMLLGSRDCCMRGSNSLTFGHSSRSWHPSSTVPHPHIHFVKLAAIPGAWLSVCTPMIYLRRPGKSTRNSWVVAPIHEAGN